jgi:hypothetical protein
MGMGMGGCVFPQTSDLRYGLIGSHILVYCRIEFSKQTILGTLNETMYYYYLRFTLT